MQSERQLQEYLKKQATIHDMGFYKLTCVGQTGFPDVLLTYKGRSIYIELKSPNGKGVLSPRQKIMIKELDRRGMEVYVAEDKETVDVIITQTLEGKPNFMYRTSV